MIRGTRFRDILRGTRRDDIFQGLAGADDIIGGDGIDTASYADSTAGVDIDLNVTSQRGGDAEGDNLYSIENVIGSSYSDRIKGNISGNRLEGGAGSDILDGGA